MARKTSNMTTTAASPIEPPATRRAAVIITDQLRSRTIEFPDDARARTAFESVARRLGRVRRVTMDYAIGGEFIVGATHVQLVMDGSLAEVDAPAHVVFATDCGEIRVPMESEAKAARVARDCSIRLLCGREAKIDNALDGSHAVFTAYGVRHESSATVD